MDRSIDRQIPTGRWISLPPESRCLERPRPFVRSGKKHLTTRERAVQPLNYHRRATPPAAPPSAAPVDKVAPSPSPRSGKHLRESFPPDLWRAFSLASSNSFCCLSMHLVQGSKREDPLRLLRERRVARHVRRKQDRPFLPSEARTGQPSGQDREKKHEGPTGVSDVVAADALPVAASCAHRCQTFRTSESCLAPTLGQNTAQESKMRENTHTAPKRRKNKATSKRRDTNELLALRHRTQPRRQSYLPPASATPTDTAPPCNRGWAGSARSGARRLRRGHSVSNRCVERSPNPGH